MTKDLRDLRPIVSLLFLSTKNLVFESLMSHPIRLRVMCSSILSLSTRTYISESPRFLIPHGHLAHILTCAQGKGEKMVQLWSQIYLNFNLGSV